MKREFNQIIWRVASFLILLLFFLGATPLDAKSSRPKSPSHSLFDVPKGLETEVAFWSAIYSQYDGNQMVIHDTQNLGIVYDVVSFTDLDNGQVPLPDHLKKKRQERLKSGVDKIYATLNSLAINPTPKKPDPLQKKIMDLYQNTKDSKVYASAAEEKRVRGQTGQKDKFIEGIKLSGKYMSYIESIFDDYNLPSDLTRMIFVESMFNLNARSKVGASGLWQFMPSTGKRFMRVTHSHDERNDPIIATHAAAKYLKELYQFVGSWPLAINSYNSGAGRLKQASRKYGHDIERIIRKFEHPAYGFASRNFYPSFLAAKQIYDNYTQYFSDVEKYPKLEWDQIELSSNVMLPQLASYCATDVEKLAELNPGFLNQIVTGQVPLNKGNTLRVPKGTQKQFLVAMNEIPAELAGLNFYVAKKGDTLKRIALQFNTSVAALKQINNFPGNLIPGQVVKLPENQTIARDSVTDTVRKE